MRYPIFLVIVLSLLAPLRGESLPLYIGTGGEAIYLTYFDSDSGTLSEPVRVADTPRPTFVWIHNHADAGPTLYSISELPRGKASGRDGQVEGAAIVSWSIDPSDRTLTETSRQDAMSDGPCFVTVSEDGRYAAIANYGGGSVAIYPIDEQGRVRAASDHVVHRGSSVNRARQSEPHAHSIRFDPSGQRLVAADLGTDTVYVYELEADGKLSSPGPGGIPLAPGSGPRHLVFSPDGNYLLVLGELSGTITAVSYQPPQYSPVQTISTMADDAAADAPRGSAEILFHPAGKWVYCSNRGPNEIAHFEFNPDGGELQRISAVASGGKHPRNFRFSPDGNFMLVANQQTDNIVVFKVDPQTGELSPTTTELNVPQPMCLKFLTAKP